MGRRRVDGRRGGAGPKGRTEGARLHPHREGRGPSSLPRRRERAPVRLAGRRVLTASDTPVIGEPTPEGRFGRFGGRFVPETLLPPCSELERAFRAAWGDPAFRAQLAALLRDYAGRPSPLTACNRLSEHLGLRLLLKREDLNHTGSHKINNVLGQALLAQRMGKTRLVAETGAGQRGVATATA